jgi:hypothetical protein
MHSARYGSTPYILPHDNGGVLRLFLLEIYFVQTAAPRAVPNSSFTVSHHPTVL